MKTNKSYLLIAAVLIFLFSLTPTHAQTNGDIVDRLNKTLGVRLPAEFEAKVKEFAANDTIMRTRSATAFTEQFIIEQFKNDWGIDRQHQLLFMWDVIYTQISEKELYDWLDDDNEVRFDNYKKQLNTLIQFEENYKKGFKEYMEQKSAEYDRQIAEARKQSIDDGLEALTEIINQFEIYITFFKDMINLDGAIQTLANFNQDKNKLIQRVEKLRSELQSNQHPSATEVEFQIKAEEQLLLDITKQRTAVTKQIYIVIENNIPEIEKRINRTSQKNGEVIQEISDGKQFVTKAKQRLTETQKAISDSKLKSAEQRIISTMALLRSAEAERMSAEARRQSAEAIKHTIENTKEGLKGLVKFYNIYKSKPQIVKASEIEQMKVHFNFFMDNCKKFNIDYKAILRKELGDEKKVKEMLKFYGIE